MESSVSFLEKCLITSKEDSKIPSLSITPSIGEKFIGEKKEITKSTTYKLMKSIIEPTIEPIIEKLAAIIEKQKEEINDLKKELKELKTNQRKRGRDELVIKEETIKEEIIDKPLDEMEKEPPKVRSRVEEVIDSKSICNFCFGNHRTDKKNCFYIKTIYNNFQKEINEMLKISREFEIPIDIITKIIQQYLRSYMKMFPRQVWNSEEEFNSLKTPIELPETFDIMPLIEKARNVKKYRENFRNMFPLQCCEACSSVYHTFSNCKINHFINHKYPVEYSKTICRRYHILPPREHWVRIQYNKHIKLMFLDSTFDMNTLPHLSEIDE